MIEQRNATYFPGMALDWVAGNLYWTETDRGLIRVAQKNGAFPQTIVSEIAKPFGVVVHPGKG